jgi:hypothetical protein
MKSVIADTQSLKPDGTWNHDHHFYGPGNDICMIICGTDIIIAKQDNGTLRHKHSIAKYAATFSMRNVISCREKCNIQKCNENVFMKLYNMSGPSVYVCKECLKKIDSVKVHKNKLSCLQEKSSNNVRILAEYEDIIYIRYYSVDLTYKKTIFPLSLHWYPTIKNFKNITVPSSKYIIYGDSLSLFLNLSKTIFINESAVKYWLIIEYIESEGFPCDILTLITTNILNA